MPRQNQDNLKPLLRSLPLYAGVGFPERDDSRGYADGLSIETPHPGLVFDKFVDTWKIMADGQQCAVQDPESKNASPKLKLGSKRAWLEETIKLVNDHKAALQDNLEKLVARQEKLVTSLGGECIPVKTDWRFVSGLGNGHPFETGFIWHRTLGVPYLPGSSVKGLMRAWADPKKGWGDEENWGRVKRLFGDTDEGGAGTLIVFDALPVQVPELELDIMNPHYGDYYGGKNDENDNPVPPADYLSPSPVFFLAVEANQPFRLALAPRCPKGENAPDDLKDGLELLEQALTTLGAGGKTAVGYGSMTYDPSSLAPDPLAEFKAWFVTQKFGATYKGRHSEVVDRLETLPDINAGKAFVKTHMKKRDCTDRLWAFLNEEVR